MKGRWLVGMMVVTMALGMTARGGGTSNTTAAAAANIIIAQTDVPATAADTGAQVSDQTPGTTVSTVVSAGAGGNTDLSACAFVEFAKKMTGANFIAVSTNGAASSVAVNQMLSAAPDSHTLLCGHNLVNAASISSVADYDYTAFKLGPTFVFDPAQQMYTNPDKYKTLDDFIKAAKAVPGQLKAYIEVGTYTHYELLVFKEAAGIDLDLMDMEFNSGKVATMPSGQVGLIPGAYINCKDYLEAGQSVCLGVPTEERCNLIKDILILRGQDVDLVYPSCEFPFYFPKETPDSIVAWYNNLVEEMISDPKAQEAIKKVEMEPYHLSAADSEKNGERIRTETKGITDDLAK